MELVTKLFTLEIRALIARKEEESPGVHHKKTVIALPSIATANQPCRQ
ncbi:hypothetical protein LINPERHAP1_LOCUS20913, partial [Linum perenne]